MKEKLLLACESSCDETAFSIIDINSNKIIAENVHSQILSHKQFNGVIPELASKEHLEKIDYLFRNILIKSNKKISDIEYFSATAGPGLPGSLLIGLNYVKALAWANGKKFIPINHLEGHIYSADLENNIQYPALCLSASGGHTSLYYVKNKKEYILLGTTIDDAAGECFDKIAKLLELGYPGGKIIEDIAAENDFRDDRKYARLKNKNYDFSFSGLKTSVLYDLVKNGYYDIETKIRKEIPNNFVKSVCSSLLCAVADIFCSRIKLAIKNFPEIESFTFVGGVSCNLFIRSEIEKILLKKKIKSYFCAPRHCVDNASMIAIRASYLLDDFKDMEVNKTYKSTIF